MSSLTKTALIKTKEYRIKSLSLNNLAKDCKYDKALEIRKNQDEAYKKFIFYKNLSKVIGGKNE